MLLVWVVLQHTGVLCCLFGESCNIQRSYLSCLSSLDKYNALNIASHSPHAIFTPPTLLVAPHLQYSVLQHCLSHPTCNIQSSNIASRTPLTSSPHLKYSPHPHISKNTKKRLEHFCPRRFMLKA